MIHATIGVGSSTERLTPNGGTTFRGQRISLPDTAVIRLIEMALEEMVQIEASQRNSSKDVIPDHTPMIFKEHVMRFLLT